MRNLAPVALWHLQFWTVPDWFRLTRAAVPSILPPAPSTGSRRATILSTRNSRLLPRGILAFPVARIGFPGQSFTQAITCSEAGEGSDRYQQCRIGPGRMSAVVSTRSRPVRSGHSPEQAGHGCHATGPLDRALADDCLHSPGIDGCWRARGSRRGKSTSDGQGVPEGSHDSRGCPDGSITERPGGHDSFCFVSRIKVWSARLKPRARRVRPPSSARPLRSSSRAPERRPQSLSAPQRPLTAVPAMPTNPGAGAGSGAESRKLPRASETPDRAILAEPSALPAPGATPPLEGPDHSAAAPVAAASNRPGEHPGAQIPSACQSRPRSGRCRIKNQRRVDGGSEAACRR